MVEGQSFCTVCLHTMEQFTDPLFVVQMSTALFVLGIAFDNFTHSSRAPVNMNSVKYRLNYLMDTFLIAIMIVASNIYIASVLLTLQDSCTRDAGGVCLFIEYFRLFIRIVLYRFVVVDLRHLPLPYQMSRPFIFLGFIYCIESFFMNGWEMFQLMQNGFQLTYSQPYGILAKLIPSALPISQTLGYCHVIANLVHLCIVFIIQKEKKMGKNVWHRVKSVFSFMPLWFQLLEIIIFYIFIYVNVDQVMQNYGLPLSTTKWVISTMVIGHLPSVFTPGVLVYYLLSRFLKLRSPFPIFKSWLYRNKKE